jgi:FkbM family methyltransferase
MARRRYGRELLAELLAVRRMSGTAGLLEFTARLVGNGRRVRKARSLAAVDEAMGSRARSFRVGGETVRLEGALYGGAREIYGRRVYFALPGFELRGSDVVVDLGANVGVFTTLAAKRCARVIAVEAQSRFLEEIERHARLNGCADKVTAVCGLIGAGTGVFSDVNRLRAGSHYALEPPRLTMPEVLERGGVDRVDFLKVDIEGSEFDLFSGDIPWLERVGRIAMEVHAGFGRPETLARRLRAHRFSVWLTDNRGVVVDAIDEPSGYLFARREA